jgi:dimethylamine monooxygenase subunit A
MSLADLFPDGDYRFHLTLRRGDVADFFRGAKSDVLAERTRWLESDPDTYAMILPAGEAAVREFAALAADWVGSAAVSEPRMSAFELVRRLGAVLEPDVLFLTRDEQGTIRLQGGALCFPTGWALREKLGHTIDFIHGVVPGLNPAIGASIQQFLTRLRPGAAFLRDNWGVAATDELNLHPQRKVAAPDLPVELDRLWLRVEHQALIALPESQAIVFGIRIALHPLREVLQGPHADGFRRALATMPAELVAYKRLDRIRDHLLNVV